MTELAAAAKAPIAATALAPPSVEAERAGDGWLLRQPVALGGVPDHLIGILRARAAEVGGRVFLAERDGAGGWRRLDYAAAAAKSGGHRRGAHRARPRARPAGGDPVGQLDRLRPPDAGLHACLGARRCRSRRPIR